MNIIKSGELVILKFKGLENVKCVNHAVSTRLGGVSTKHGLESLNMGSHTADSIENIRENYRRFCSCAGFIAEKTVLAQQTHSANVRLVTESDAGKGIFRDRDYSDIDSLICNISHIPLVIHTADCVPVSFTDEKNKAIGNAHCGWRGTYECLASVTADEMKKNFGTQPENLVCTIGPCICRKCYEVSEDLYNKFYDRFGFDDAIFCDNNKFYLDLALINKYILIKCGVKEKNIFVSDLCTCCNTKYFFSHRGQGPERGIFASVIELV